MDKDDFFDSIYDYIPENHTSNTNSNKDLSVGDVIHLAWATITFGILMALMVFVVADIFKKFKRKNRFFKLVSLFLLYYTVIDMLDYIFQYQWHFTSLLQNHAQSLAYTVEFGRLSQRMALVALGVISYIRVRALGSTSTALIAMSKNKSFHLIFLFLIGWGLPAMLLTYRVYHKHVTIINIDEFYFFVALSCVVALMLIYFRAKNVSFHLTSHDEVNANKIIVCYLAIATAESIVYLVVHEFCNIVLPLTDYEIHLLVIQLREGLHELEGMFYAIFYLIFVRSETLHLKIFPGLNNPGLAPMSANDECGSYPLGLNRPVAYDTEMNALVFPEIDEQE